MRELSDSGARAINQIARQTAFSVGAVRSMLHAIELGGGHMAQFSHAEFSGYGQWMAGGMTMIGDMFNDELKGRVRALCVALSALLADNRNFRRIDDGDSATQHPRSNDRARDVRHDVTTPMLLRSTSNPWWPHDLGTPDSTGSQNVMRYAYFARSRRLVVDDGSSATVYDTLDHDIGGFSQQQSADASVKFSSQHGTVALASLPVVTRLQRSRAQRS